MASIIHSVSIRSVSFLTGKIIAGLLVCFLASFAQAADDDFPGFEKLMSEKEFESTGLGKLSDDELNRLNQWLIRYTAGDAQILQTTSEAVREAEKSYEVRSRLADGFSGWTGKTIFRLENGQVWKQRLSGRYPYRGPANPEVIISKNWAGFFKMTLVDLDKSIGVTQIVD